ncbi:MAG: DUF1963 domain-containing protein [Planctomycetaceae bacterium]
MIENVMTLQLLQEQRDHISYLIGDTGLSSFSSEILNGAYSAYRLLGKEQTESSELGISRFGGEPDVPQSFDTAQLLDLVFIYQVNMADLPQANILGLPDSGLISVFADINADYGKAFYFEDVEFIRHRMPPKDPDYVFGRMLPWTLNVEMVVDFPRYGDDLVVEIIEAGLEEEYEKLCDRFGCSSDKFFGQILGRFSDLNGDMRQEAVRRCGGETDKWRSFWKILSSYKSGLVISDFHEIHGLIQHQHLQDLDFSRVFSETTNG